METIRFRYAEADLVAANLAFYRANLRRWRTWVPAVVMTIVALCGLAMIGWNSRGGPLWLIVGGIGGAVIAGLLIHLFNLHYLRRYSARNFTQQRSLREEFTLDWNADGFESRSDSGSQRVAWADLHRWSDAETVVMLYLAERLYIAVPKAAMSAGQHAAMLDHLSRALPGGANPA